MNSRRLIGNVESVDIPLRETRTRIWPDVPQFIPKLSVSERGVHAASLSLLPHLSLNSNLVGSFMLKRTDRRRTEAALFRFRLRLRRDRVVAKRRRRRAAKAEVRARTNRHLLDAADWPGRMKPQPPDRGPSRLRGRSHFGAAKARSEAASLVERLSKDPTRMNTDGHG